MVEWTSEDDRPATPTDKATGGLDAEIVHFDPGPDAVNATS
jgi:hypothetical protein